MNVCMFCVCVPEFLFLLVCVVSDLHELYSNQIVFAFSLGVLCFYIAQLSFCLMFLACLLIANCHYHHHHHHRSHLRAVFGRDADDAVDDDDEGPSWIGA